MKAIIKDSLLAIATIFFSLFIFNIPSARAALCGDLFCEVGEEDQSSCPMDCGTCGDLDCDASETSSSCPLDCLGFCGDFTCEPEEESSCPEDCDSPVCGDDLCQAEEMNNCALDCIDLPGLCESDADCDDGNACTTDVCDNPNGCIHTPLPDTDSDGTCDANDADDDNDGVGDADDSEDLNPDVCRDVDADNCDDCAVGVDDFGPEADFNPANDGADNDGDGACDAGDADDDNDGLDDDEEIVTDPFDPDTDDDSVCDGPLAVAAVCTAGPDNCPITANPRQSDADADGIGDACDPNPIEDVSGLCPCDTCPDGLTDVEIPGVPGFPSHVVDKATCHMEREWRNHGEYVSCVTHVTNFLKKYTSFDKGKVQSEAARSRCGRESRNWLGGYHRPDGHFWYDGHNGYNGHDRYGGHDGFGGHSFCFH